MSTFAKEIMFSSLFVCLSVSNLHEIFREGWQWARLVRRVLAEVCTVPVLLVS